MELFPGISAGWAWISGPGASRRYRLVHDSPCWHQESSVRCSVQGQSGPDRMDAQLPGSEGRLPESRLPSCGPVGVQAQPPVGDVLFTSPISFQQWSECTHTELGHELSVTLSTQEGQGKPISGGSSGRSVLAEPSVVQGLAEMMVDYLIRLSVRDKLLSHTLTWAGVPPPDWLAIVSQFKREGFLEKLLEQQQPLDTHPHERFMIPIWLHSVTGARTEKWIRLSILYLPQALAG